MDVGSVACVVSRWVGNFAGLLLGLACAVPCQAATGPGAATAAVVTAGQLVKVEDLRFGLIIPTATGGTVVINPATGARTKTGGPILAGTGYGPAQFIALSTPPLNSFLTINIPASVTINRVGGGASMLVNNLNISGFGTAVFNAQGFYQFFVGGQLNVGANQTLGTYTNTFTVTVNFF
jgi:hypothetical protein